MKFPEWLYALLPGDEGTQKLSLIWREQSATGVAAVLGTTVYTVPSDKCLVLTNASLRFINLNLATLQRRRLMADPPDGTTRYTIYENELNIAAGSIQSDNWQGEVVVPGSWKIRVEGEFGTPDAGDSVAAEIFGYLIPRGTFIFG